jgi:gliding motility-associated-like protein
MYVLPNVFTPNSDGINDLFVPLEGAQFIEKIHLTVYNRWGSIVFRTDDPMINWDGNETEKNEPCSPGVYYYDCDVFEIRLTGTKVRNLAGTITIFR